MSSASNGNASFAGIKNFVTLKESSMDVLTANTINVTNLNFSEASGSVTIASLDVTESFTYGNTNGGMDIRNFIMKSFNSTGLAFWQDPEPGGNFINTPGSTAFAIGTSTAFIELWLMGGGGGGGGGGVSRTTGTSGGNTTVSTYAGTVVLTCYGGQGAQTTTESIGGSTLNGIARSAIAIKGGDGGLGGDFTQTTTNTLSIAGATGVGNGCGASAIGTTPTNGSLGSGSGGCGGWARIGGVTGTIEAGGAGAQGGFIHIFFDPYDYFVIGFPVLAIVGAGGTGGADTGSGSITGSAGGNGGGGYVYFVRRYV